MLLVDREQFAVFHEDGPVADGVADIAAARGVREVAHEVRHTVCDGTVLMEDRELLTIDEEQAKREAEEQAQALFDRAGV